MNDFFDKDNYNFYEDICQNKNLVKDLNGCLNIFFRFCKEKNLYTYIKSKTSKKRLLGVLYDMRYWPYNYPCPLQHSFCFSNGIYDDAKDFRFISDFREWSFENNVKDYKEILNKY